MGNGSFGGWDTHGIGSGAELRNVAGSSAHVDLDSHATLGSMKSLIIWAVLGIAATVSASWIQSSPDPAGGTQVAQQQVVQPQFPAQARSGEGGISISQRGMMPGMPGVPVRPPEATTPPPQMVMPRAVPGVPGPPPSAAVVQQPAVPTAPPPTWQRRGLVPPIVTREQPAPGQAPAPVQTAIPFSR